MELSLHDTNNPICHWMEMGRSNVDPVLDEEDTESDTPLPFGSGEDAVKRITP